MNSARQLINALLPRGGYLVTLAEVYMDESGSHEGAPMLCVAGYVFEHEQAIAFNDEWRAFLGRRNLPYFRMSQCALRKGPFRERPRDECIEIASEAIQIIKKRTAVGFSAKVNEREYEEFLKPCFPKEVNPYTFLLFSCLSQVHNWARGSKFDGDIAYFFEAGHKHAGAANEFLNEQVKHAAVRGHYRYFSHTFGSKLQFLPLQAADVLAWHAFKDVKAQLVAGEMRPRRKDYYELLHAHDLSVTFTEKKLRLAARRLARNRRLRLRAPFR